MTFAQFVSNILGMVNYVIVPLIFAFAALSFLWGIINYFFLSVGDTAKQGKARSFMLYGLLGMVILFSVWGFVIVIIHTFGL